MSGQPFFSPPPAPDLPLRRPSANTRRFVPRTETPDEQSAVILQRNVLRASVKPPKPQTDRKRVIAGDLPEWDPLPPGELFVKRPSR